MHLFTKLKQTHRLMRRNLWLPGWKDAGREGIVKEFGMHIYTLLYLKWITTKTCYIACGTLLNVMLQPGWEGSLENGFMYTDG